MVRWAEIGVWDSGQPLVCVLSDLPITLYLSKETFQIFYVFGGPSQVSVPFGVSKFQDYRLVCVYIYVQFVSCHFCQVSNI